jgi:hypothetical protein
MLTLTSSAFPPQGEIPSKYTCQGQDVSPPLAWSDVPSNAKSLVLIVEDPSLAGERLVDQRGEHRRGPDGMAPPAQAPAQIWLQLLEDHRRRSHL